MPNRKISQLPQTFLPTTLEDTDRLPLARSGNTFHILGSDVKSPILSQAQSTMLTKVNSLSARDSATIDLSFSSASYALSADVRDGSISTQHLSAGAVTTSIIAPSAVTTSIIAPSAVTTEKIAPGAVTTEKIAPGAVTTEKIAPGAVRYSQLATWQELSALPTLSAEAITQRVAKAWINFDGTSGSIGKGRSSFNVSSVTDLGGLGWYRVNFITPMPNDDYAVAGSCFDLITEPDPTTFGVVSLNPNYVEVYSNRGDTGRIDNSIISVIIFST